MLLPHVTAPCCDFWWRHIEIFWMIWAWRSWCCLAMLNYGTSCLLINCWILGSPYCSWNVFGCLGRWFCSTYPWHEKYFRIFVFCDLDERHSGTILLAQKIPGEEWEDKLMSNGLSWFFCSLHPPATFSFLALVNCPVPWLPSCHGARAAHGDAGRGCEQSHGPAGVVQLLLPWQLLPQRCLWNQAALDGSDCSCSLWDGEIPLFWTATEMPGWPLDPLDSWGHCIREY